MAHINSLYQQGLYLSPEQQNLLMAALNFPRCRPGHQRVQLGFYDSENEVSGLPLATEPLPPNICVLIHRLSVLL